MIASSSGRHTTPFWRPPYGAVDAGVRRAAASAGWGYTDHVDAPTRSTGGRAPTVARRRRAVAAKVVAGRTAGGVVLMHLGGYPTRNALPAMVSGLRAAGYRPTTVSALFR